MSENNVWNNTFIYSLLVYLYLNLRRKRFQALLTKADLCHRPRGGAWI